MKFFLLCPTHCIITFKKYKAARPRDFQHRQLVHPHPYNPRQRQNCTKPQPTKALNNPHTVRGETVNYDYASKIPPKL